MKSEPSGKKLKFPVLKVIRSNQRLNDYWDKVWQYLNLHETKRRLLGIGTTLILCLLFLSSLYGERLNVQTGDVIKRDIVATREVLDYNRWDEIQREVERKVSKEASENPENYRVEKTYLYSAEEDFQEIFRLIVENRIDNTARAKDVGSLQSLIRQQTKLEIPASTLRTLMLQEDDALNILRTTGLGIIATVMEKGVSSTNITQAQELVSQLFLEADTDIEFDVLTATSEVTQAVLRPNLILDSVKVRKIVDDAIETARVDAPKIKKGQVIVREGDVLTDKVMLILDELNLLKKSWNWPKALGIIAFTIIIAGVYYYFLYMFYKHLENKYFALYSLIVVIIAVLGKLLSLIEWPYAMYFFPSSAGTMLITVLINPMLGVFSALAFSLMTALYANFAIAPVLISLFGAIVGVYCVNEATQRSTLMQAGLLVGLSNTITMAAVGLVMDNSSLIIMCFIGFFTGIISAILTIGVLPYLEIIFSVTSPMRLLELSNPNNPLLRRLSLEAPGTYHHSIVVGNLAEAAAEAVGADPLLTRVGALYHDVGKIIRPYFFVENQRGGENPHDKMAPNLSRMVILNHVKEGIELAKDYKIPDIIIDFIAEHHGKSMVQYFYQKAVEQDQNPVLPEDYRYPGPKPRSKETAILMLADSSEAAVRSLTRPTYDKVQSMIRNVVKSKLDKGELDDCNLTLSELDLIADTMSRVAAGIHHTRIKYPGQKI